VPPAYEQQAGGKISEELFVYTVLPSEKREQRLDVTTESRNGSTCRQRY